MFHVGEVTPREAVAQIATAKLEARNSKFETKARTLGELGALVVDL